MFALGAGMLALGMRGDASGFWEDRPFLTNVFSSLTAAMFGIPIALAVLQQIAAAQASHAAGVRQRDAATKLLEGMVHQIGNGFPELLSVGELIGLIDALGRMVRSDENRSEYRARTMELLDRWADAFSRPRYDHSIAALVKAGEQLSVIRAVAMENGFSWSGAIPADVTPPLDSAGINDWRRRAFPGPRQGSGWNEDEPRWEGLAEARECARRVQEYHTSIHNAWYLLRR
ncbi:hypothetical protein Ait01nite_076670 [Actinoplanes italicus]|uniref:Uncharacterized protein n=1 Tax=Actinoplanes italicus TaxID=113567 RepID=A0A2T0JZ05_9ACTN|nr:hypothetical protein [Actinoplanes italicus]PRX14757.1 hypothetical protein CLV67_123143 [Actinoplanes italicus]GIE34622.1 hypothetical protein Ait01nite_076670 [Actinoplanes italicus]